MAILHINLLGDFRLRYDETLVTTVVQPRMQAFLAYLLIHRDSPQPRQKLAFLFWPDTSESQARTNLRQLLHNLHRALPDADQFLHIETKTKKI
jgi:DNA-binding SARP family transcriptional activator